MAINPTSAELLLCCRQIKPEASEVLMLGRQWLRLRRKDADRLKAIHAIELGDLCDDEGRDERYGEPFFQRLGMQRVDSLDASSYQGASLIADLNKPLSAGSHPTFDWVYDGGTLEHVFNQATAAANIASLLRSGGLFIAMTPCNNWMGHGLYQFSPELLFRLYDESRGFRCRFAALYEHQRDRFWSLQDPARTGRRNAFNPPGRLSLLFVAEKIGPPNAESTVNQSDYQSAWQDPAKVQIGTTAWSAPGLMRQLCPSWLAAGIRRWRVKRRRQREGMLGCQRHHSLRQAWQQRPNP